MKRKIETQVSAVIAVFCYSVAFAALFVFGYSLLSLALSAAGQHIRVLYSTSSYAESHRSTQNTND